ncbi:MAG: pyridoxal-phosphate dependent enzyme [Variibacter sp.]
MAIETPLKRSSHLGGGLEQDVYLKIETTQPSGSFKLRGATNKMLSLGPDEKQRGVITASTGNHGRAVAYAARHLGIRCVICLSKLVPANEAARKSKSFHELPSDRLQKVEYVERR